MCGNHSCWVRSFLDPEEYDTGGGGCPVNRAGPLDSSLKKGMVLMPAYLIANIEITDPSTYDQYKKLVPPTIAKYGGRYLARGGATEVLQGEWTPKRLVIVEFPAITPLQA